MPITWPSKARLVLSVISSLGSLYVLTLCFIEIRWLYTLLWIHNIERYMNGVYSCNKVVGFSFCKQVDNLQNIRSLWIQLSYLRANPGEVASSPPKIRYFMVFYVAGLIGGAGTHHPSPWVPANFRLGHPICPTGPALPNGSHPLPKVLWAARHSVTSSYLP